MTTGRRDQASSHNGTASLDGFPDRRERNRLTVKHLNRRNRQTETDETHVIKLHCKRPDEIIRPWLLRLLKNKRLFLLIPDGSSPAERDFVNVTF